MPTWQPSDLSTATVGTAPVHCTSTAEQLTTSQVATTAGANGRAAEEGCWSHKTSRTRPETAMRPAWSCCSTTVALHPWQWLHQYPAATRIKRTSFKQQAGAAALVKRDGVDLAAHLHTQTVAAWHIRLTT